MKPDAGGAAPPLFVDLDGTLVRTDMLVESCVNAVRSNVFVLFRLPRWIARGRAYVKRELAARGRPDVASLPYRQDVLEFLRTE
ncbi:MAG: prenyltransferase, partial [Planctomycetota bacterium]